jgi:hypothetical protein
MSQPQMDEDQDLRQLLQTPLPSTSAEHDAAVLQAARNFARSEAPLTLGPAAARSARPSRRWLATGWAAAAGIAAIVVTGAAWREQVLRRQPDVLTEQSNASSRAAMLLSPVLSPGMTRGQASLTEVAVPAGASVVNLRLELATPTAVRPGYRIDLNTLAGTTVWRGEAPAAQAHGQQGIVTAEIPAAVLASGDYELSLRESTASPPGQVDYYYFKVRRE